MNPDQPDPPAGDPQPGVSVDLRTEAAELLELHWRPEGFTMPNQATYPWQWLWDSCFHALVWARLGDARALTEIEKLFTFQTAAGFVPHMNYLPDPDAAIEVWGRSGASTITQPPMYGHAIAELVRGGVEVGDATLAAAERGLRFLFEHRRRSASGLIELVHPWESGCDDSARWDAAMDAPWTRERWREHKWHLVSTVITDDDGGAIANDEFRIASVGFNALIAFNALELASVTGSEWLSAQANDLAARISARWDAELRTWVDDGDLASTTGQVRTVDAHFALLVDPDRSHTSVGLADLVDPSAFGAAHGPAGIHRSEPTRDPRTYWRGPAWPQMSYLLWAAASRLGDDHVAASIATSLIAGAQASGWAEFWEPDTGEGLGAIPQSWATVALLVV